MTTTSTALAEKSRDELINQAFELGLTRKDIKGDSRKKITWIEAILAKLGEQISEVCEAIAIPFDGDDDIAVTPNQQPCPECDGTGLILNFEGTDDEPCDVCLGFGVVQEIELIPTTIITVRQPWATWIACRIKTHETRSWETKHRGKILIHAGKRKINWNEITDLDILKKYWPDIQDWDYPLGEIISQGELIDCYPAIPGKSDLMDECCGFWDRGWFAWALVNVSPLSIPDISGKEGLWKYPIPKNLLTPTINNHLWAVERNWPSRSITELVLGGKNAT